MKVPLRIRLKHLKRRALNIISHHFSIVRLSDKKTKRKITHESVLACYKHLQPLERNLWGEDACEQCTYDWRQFGVLIHKGSWQLVEALVDHSMEMISLTQYLWPSTASSPSIIEHSEPTDTDSKVSSDMTREPLAYIRPPLKLNKRLRQGLGCNAWLQGPLYVPFTSNLEMWINEIVALMPEKIHYVVRMLCIRHRQVIEKNVFNESICPNCTEEWISNNSPPNDPGWIFTVAVQIEDIEVIDFPSDPDTNTERLRRLIKKGAFSAEPAL